MIKGKRGESHQWVLHERHKAAGWGLEAPRTRRTSGWVDFRWAGFRHSGRKPLVRRPGCPASRRSPGPAGGAAGSDARGRAQAGSRRCRRRPGSDVGAAAHLPRVPPAEPGPHRRHEEAVQPHEAAGQPDRGQASARRGGAAGRGAAAGGGPRLPSAAAGSQPRGLPGGLARGRRAWDALPAFWGAPPGQPSPASARGRSLGTRSLPPAPSLSPLHCALRGLALRGLGVRGRQTRANGHQRLAAPS